MVILWLEIAFIFLLAIWLVCVKKITLDAFFLGLLVSSILALWGGEEWLRIFLIVVILSLIVPKLFENKERLKKERRNWKDLLAVSFSSVICVVGYRFGIQMFISLVPFYAALSFIVSDIFSSEIYLPFWKTKARLFTRGFASVPHGTPGAVSFSGLVYSFIGASCVGALYFVFYGMLKASMAIIMIGFLSCFFESIFNNLKQHIKIKYSNELTNLSFALAAILGGSLV